MIKPSLRVESEPGADYPLGDALDFLKRLWQLNQALEKLSGRMEKRYGVTAQQRLVLRCIGKHPGLTSGHLASLLHVDPGTVSATLKRLEHKKLIARRRDRADKRRVVLALTAKGAVLNRPSEGTVEGAVERLLGSSPTSELALAAKTLERLTLLLGEQLREDGQCDPVLVDSPRSARGSPVR